MTPDDAQYLNDACEAFSEEIDGEVVGYVGLDAESSCRWSIVGFTVQGWLNLQQNLILIESYVSQLRNQRDFYKEQLIKQYESVNKNEATNTP